jgi:hypothetical protein
MTALTSVGSSSQPSSLPALNASTRTRLGIARRSASGTSARASASRSRRVRCRQRTAGYEHAANSSWRCVSTRLALVLHAFTHGRGLACDEKIQVGKVWEGGREGIEQIGPEHSRYDAQRAQALRASGGE